jgi:hypothetical protein
VPFGRLETPDSPHPGQRAQVVQKPGFKRRRTPLLTVLIPNTLTDDSSVDGAIKRGGGGAVFEAGANSSSGSAGHGVAGDERPAKRPSRLSSSTADKL